MPNLHHLMYPGRVSSTEMRILSFMDIKENSAACLLGIMWGPEKELNSLIIGTDWEVLCALNHNVQHAVSHPLASNVFLDVQR